MHDAIWKGEYHDPERGPKRITMVFSSHGYSIVMGWSSKAVLRRFFWGYNPIAAVPPVFSWGASHCLGEGGNGETMKKHIRRHMLEPIGSMQGTFAYLYWPQKINQQ